MGQAAGVSGKIIQFVPLAAHRQAKTEGNLHAQLREAAKRRYQVHGWLSPNPRLSRGARCGVMLASPKDQGVPRRGSDAPQKMVASVAVAWKKPQSWMAGNSKSLQETAAFPHGTSSALVQP